MRKDKKLTFGEKGREKNEGRMLVIVGRKVSFSQKERYSCLMGL